MTAAVVSVPDDGCVPLVAFRVTASSVVSPSTMASESAAFADRDSLNHREMSSAVRSESQSRNQSSKFPSYQ